MADEPTPGPWLAATRPSSVVGWPVVAPAAMGRSICSVTTGHEDAAANARLIAAAPCMRDALADLIVRFERCCKAGGSDDEFIKLATAKHRAALAKARGEEIGVGDVGSAGAQGEPA